MIQDILPHRYDNSFKRPRLTEQSFLMYILKGNILLIRRKDREGNGLQGGDLRIRAGASCAAEFLARDSQGTGGFRAGARICQSGRNTCFPLRYPCILW